MSHNSGTPELERAKQRLYSTQNNAAGQQGPSSAQSNTRKARAAPGARARARPGSASSLAASMRPSWCPSHHAQQGCRCRGARRCRRRQGCLAPPSCTAVVGSGSQARMLLCSASAAAEAAAPGDDAAPSSASNPKPQTLNH